MRRFIIIALMIASNASFASTTKCVTTTFLDLSTGKDPLTNNLLPNGSQDPNWIITGLTAQCSALPGAVPIGSPALVAPRTWPYYPSSAKWISFLPDAAYQVSQNSDNYLFGFTATRSFNVCETDSFLINFLFANDNFCTDISVNGMSIFAPQSASPNAANYSSPPTSVTNSLTLNSGINTISITVYNFPIIGFNPHAFIVSGGISSIAGNSTLVDPSNSDCECNIVSDCDDKCFWKLEGNIINGSRNKLGTISNDNVRLISNNIERGIITNTGLLGWNNMTPTAYLHVDCIGHNGDNNGLSDIRFENLEEGKGNIMVIRKDGYVFDSKMSLERIVDMTNTLMVENENMKKQILDMSEKINSLLLEQSRDNSNSNSLRSYLKNNYPNPFGTQTNISYYIDNFKFDAKIVIFDMNGKETYKYAIQNKGDGFVSINARDLPNNGTYTYSLVIDGEIIDSKKMVVNK